MRGFTLIEVLVAMLLAAVAVLALTGAQVAALRGTRIAQHRMVAAQLAADFAERLRANREGILAAQTDGNPYRFTSESETSSGGLDKALAKACEGLDARCSPNAFAQADAAQWRELLRRALPSAVAHVKLDMAANGADVWVAWREPGPAVADEIPKGGDECPMELGTTHSLRCVHLRSRW